MIPLSFLWGQSPYCGALLIVPRAGGILSIKIARPGLMQPDAGIEKGPPPGWAVSFAKALKSLIFEIEFHFFVIKS